MKTSVKSLLGMLKNLELGTNGIAPDYRAAGFALGVSSVQAVTRQGRKPKRTIAQANQ